MKKKMNVTTSPKGQAMPAEIIPVESSAFAEKDGTYITWLGGAGILINSEGTVIMIDPLLEGFDMPLLIESPLNAKDVPKCDAVLVTHIDNDHFSRQTLKAMDSVSDVYHAPEYVASEMEKEGLGPAIGHKIGDVFEVGDVEVKLTPALHNWQNYMEKYNYREWKPEEYCGFWIDTPDGTIWLPGDSKLLDEHLQMPSPDVILLDFADNSWHITFDGAVKLANTYPDADLLLIHWGSVDAPDMNTFNGDPVKFAESVVNPERVYALAPGDTLELKRRG